MDSLLDCETVGTLELLPCTPGFLWKRSALSCGNAEPVECDAAPLSFCGSASSSHKSSINRGIIQLIPRRQPIIILRQHHHILYQRPFSADRRPIFMAASMALSCEARRHLPHTVCFRMRSGGTLQRLSRSATSRPSSPKPSVETRRLRPRRSRSCRHRVFLRRSAGRLRFHPMTSGPSSCRLPAVGLRSDVRAAGRCMIFFASGFSS